MGGVCRVGVDSAGGLILGSLQNGTVFANGSKVSVNNDPVQGHGVGVHAGPVMIASSSVYVNGKMMCVSGNTATCGHPASGSGNVFAN